MACAEYILEQENKRIEIGFAREFQDSVRNSKVLSYANDTLKIAILERNPNELLIVTSQINSPKKILSVDKYNEEFLNSALG